jgi:hypothetical protein
VDSSLGDLYGVSNMNEDLFSITGDLGPLWILTLNTTTKLYKTISRRNIGAKGDENVF